MRWILNCLKNYQSIMVKSNLLDILQKICNNVDRMFENGELYQLIYEIGSKIIEKSLSRRSSQVNTEY